MKPQAEPLGLMSNSERDSYCAFLRRIAGKRRGSIAEHLRRLARELSGSFA